MKRYRIVEKNNGSCSWFYPQVRTLYFFWNYLVNHDLSKVKLNTKELAEEVVVSWLDYQEQRNIKKKEIIH